MGRITRDEMLMGVAEVVAKRGTCSRLQVGAIISRDGRIIATGYNGAPAGIPHCTHDEFIWPTPDKDIEAPDWLAYHFTSDSEMKFATPRPGDHFAWDGRTISMSSGYTGRSFGCGVAEHSERNAIAFAARHGLSLDQSEVHVTHAPCLDCSRSIINAGIVKVSYAIPYRLTAGVELLAQAGIDVVDMPPTAMVR